jgi:SAM-dependent methyltransferase
MTPARLPTFLRRSGHSRLAGSMALIAYNDDDAAAFEAARHIAREGLTAWKAAVSRHLNPRSGTRLLDLGSGTGIWASAFTDWYDIEVVAVEPSQAMRARSSHLHVLPGDAGAIPLGDAAVDAAWLSTMIHHVPDLTAAAQELRRVVRPGGLVLIRSAFAGRHESIMLFRFFPEAIRVLDAYPSVAAGSRPAASWTRGAAAAPRRDAGLAPRWVGLFASGGGLRLRDGRGSVRGSR